MFTKLLSVSASLILSVAGIASGADSMPTKFTYACPRSVEEALALLAHGGDEAKILLFLVIERLSALRLHRPSCLI